MLTNYTAEQNRFAWFWFGLPNLRAAISFQNRNNDPYGRGELRFALNNDENRENLNGFENIMTIKHVWNTWAVWINTWPSLPSVALEINDTMRLEPRNGVPFQCDETTAWSMFMYIYSGTKTPILIYPCFCGNVNIELNNNEYNWYAMWRWEIKLCGEESW